MFNLENCTKHKLRTQFTVTTSYDGEWDDDIAKFTEGLEVYVLCKVRDADYGKGSIYAVYSPELKETTCVHGLYLSGLSQ